MEAASEVAGCSPPFNAAVSVLVSLVDARLEQNVFRKMYLTRYMAELASGKWDALKPGPLLDLAPQPGSSTMKGVRSSQAFHIAVSSDFESSWFSRLR